MTAHDSLLRSVCERPFDDGPRLVYADWLDENGEPERAEFIRRAIHYPHSEFVELTGGKQNPFVLLGMTERNWSWAEGDHGLVLIDQDSNGVRYRVSRGFPSSVSLSLRQLLGGECPVCTRESLSDTLNELGRQIGRRLPCPRCSGSGRSPGLAPALAKWPITEVVISDAVIHASGGNDTYYLGGLGSFPKEYWRRLEGHRSRQDVRTAVSQVSVDFLRSHATPPLPALMWPKDSP